MKNDKDYDCYKELGLEMVKRSMYDHFSLETKIRQHAADFMSSKDFSGICYGLDIDPDKIRKMVKDSQAKKLTEKFNKLTSGDSCKMQKAKYHYHQKVTTVFGLGEIEDIQYNFERKVYEYYVYVKSVKATIWYDEDKLKL